MAKKPEPTLEELVISHKPKNFKYYYHFHEDADYIQLAQNGFDMSSLDTLMNPELIKFAMQSDFKYYDRDIVAHAKEPTFLENGVIMTKKMATKTDKKLERVGVSQFEYNDLQYVAVKLCYQKFDIYELFIMT